MDLAEGTRVGPYRIAGEIGRGGMGAVYRAERADGTFEKAVALKLVKLGMDTDAVLRRFRDERRILAGLDHPHIARLLDAGAAADGRPYLVMELAEGAPITAYAERRGLDVETRLALFEQAVEAVQHAHRRLVVHRDLKPSNILVTEAEDGTPCVKLLDFGIARLLGAEAEATRSEVRFLTPEYAAPEQIDGGSVTTATDVYALGAVLYELLTGRRPGSAPVAPGAAVADPVRRRALRGDLDTLVLTALHADPKRRYASAEAFLGDLRRRRAGLPLRARPETLGYRARKFVGRHRLGVAMAGLAMAGLVAAALILAVQQREAARARDEAEASAAFLESLFAAADPFAEERQDTLRIRDLLAPGLARVRVEFADQPTTRGRLLHVIGTTYLRLGLFPEAEAALREAVALRRAAAPPADLAASLSARASALLETGRPDEAAMAASEARRLAAGDAALMTEAEQRQALALTDLGRAGEAEAILRAAWERLEREGSLGRPAVADVERTLGRVLLSQGRIADAEAAYRTALGRYERLFGADDPRRLGVLRDLSFALLMDGRLLEAEAVGAEAVAVTRATRPGSGSLANILAVYGAILRRLGRLDEAEVALREAAALPPRRPADRAVPFGTLASVLAQRGDLAGAVAAQREALAVLRAARPPDDPSAAYSAVKLAGFLRESRRFEEAERLLLDAHRVLTADTTGRHPQGRQAANELAALYEAWGRLGEAARWRTEAE